jgi:hypothetical protein
MASGCRIGTCGVCLDDGVRGVACGAQARHIICATCAPMEVQRVLQDLLEPTALERFRQRGGLIKCVQDGCIATYSDEFLAPLLPASTEQNYRREQADVARYHRVIRAAGDSEEAATAQYLRDHYRNAVQCPRCGAGPVIPEQCADLQAHHGETLSRGGRISNACPSCGFFSRNRGDWASWDGLLRRSQESPPRGAQEQPRHRVVARVGDHEVVNAGLNAVPDGVHATLPSWAWLIITYEAAPDMAWIGVLLLFLVTQCAQPGARPCPKGKFDSGLAKGCVECPPGLFKHSDGAGMCMPEGSYTASCDQCALMGFAPNQQLRCTCKNGKGHVESALRLSTCKNGEWVGNVNGILSCKPVPLGFEGGLVKSIVLAAGAAVTSTVGYGLYWLLTQGD